MVRNKNNEAGELMFEALFTKINNYLKTILAKVGLRLLMAFLSIMFVVVIISSLFITEYRTTYNTIYKERVARLKYIDDFAYEILEYQNSLVQKKQKTFKQAQTESMEMIKRVHFESDDYIWIDKYTGLSFYHPMPDRSKNTLVDAKISKIVHDSGQGYLRYKWEKLDANKKKKFDKVSYVKGYKNWGWILGTGTYIDDINYLVIKSMLVGNLPLLLFFAFIIILLRFILLVSVIKPIDDLAEISLRLANNDLDVVLPSPDGNTELGKLYMVVNKFVELFEREKKTAQREALLRTITEKIRSSLDIDETLSFICEETAKLFNVQRSAISKFRNSDNYEVSVLKKEYKAFFSLSGIDNEKYFNKLAEYLGYKLQEAGAVVAFDNIEDTSNPDYFRNTYRSMGVKSLIVASIRQDDNTWGLLVLSEYNNCRHWTGEEKNLLETIASQLYIVIKQAELYQNTKRIAERERLLRELVSAVSSTFDLDGIIHTFVFEIGKSLKAQKVFFSKYEEASNTLLSPDEYFEYRDSSAVMKYKDMSTILDEHFPVFTEQVKSTKSMMLIPDVAKFFNENGLENSIDAETVHRYNFNSAIAFPVVSQSKLLGFYGIEYASITDLTQPIIDFLTTLSKQTVIAMIQAELYSTIDKNEKYTRTVLDSIKDGIITVSDDFIIESCNPSVETIWGYPVSDIVGKPLELILYCDVENKDKKEYLYGKKTLGVRKNGEKFPVEIDVSEINFENRKSQLLVIRDVTERKKIDKMKSEFVSTVSHELRTPLTSIKGSLGLITSGVFGAFPEKVDNLLNIANNNCIRLTNLINDILDLEKIKAGKYEFIYEELELNSLVEQSVILNQSYADQFRMNLKVVNLVGEAYIKADKNRILQVISNLISNAVKFSHLGGEVTIISELVEDKVKISFLDKGIGIPEESKYKIFQSFSQVDSSDTRSKGGTGLGLSICKLIIENMDGNIGFDSQIDKGSTFFFSMPIIEKGSFINADDKTVKELDPDEF